MIMNTAISKFAFIPGSEAQVDLTQIQVTGCDSATQQCIFPKGRMATISLPFTPGKPRVIARDSVHQNIVE